MLPVVTHTRAVGRQIVFYSWLMVGASLLLVPIAPMGWFYTIAATVLGGVFLTRPRDAGPRHPRRRCGADAPVPLVDHVYLSLLFLAIAIDPFLFS